MPDVTVAGDGALRVFLAPPAFLVITATEVTLFDGGDAGRVLWRSPDDRSEITCALQTPGR